MTSFDVFVGALWTFHRNTLLLSSSQPWATHVWINICCCRGQASDQELQGLQLRIRCCAAVVPGFSMLVISAPNGLQFEESMLAMGCRLLMLIILQGRFSLRITAVESTGLQGQLQDLSALLPHHLMPAWSNLTRCDLVCHTLVYPISI